MEPYHPILSFVTPEFGEEIGKFDVRLILIIRRFLSAILGEGANENHGINCAVHFSCGITFPLSPATAQSKDLSNDLLVVFVFLGTDRLSFLIKQTSIR
eukprot:scaffold594_cov52-Cylindrotheca_fusiformis.AAC.1